MGVRHDLTEERIANALERWGRGRAWMLRPTAHGIENTNYFVTLADAAGFESEWVLTVMTEPPSSAALEVLARLDAAGLPVAAPVADTTGAVVGRVADHPALLAPRRPGAHPEAPTPAQCTAIGRFLAAMHAHTRGLEASEHPRDLAWLRRGLACHRPALAPDDVTLLERALAAVGDAMVTSAWQQLPAAVIHGDLFRDNALFEGERLTAVLDFHHAARAPQMFDLAVAVNDWCIDAHARLDAPRTDAMLRAYAAARPLEAAEIRLWPVMLVLAALRFWVARLDSPRKNPTQMRERLADYLAEPPVISGA